MNVGEKDEYELENRNENSMNYKALAWQFGCSNLTSTPMSLVPTDNPLVFVGSSSASVSMVDSFCSNLCEPCEINVHNGASSSNATGWNATSSMLKGGVFLPQSLSQLPTDLAFIERAAKFSSFNGGNFSDMVNPFGIPESMGLYSRGLSLMQGSQDVFPIGGMKSVPGVACLQADNRATTQESPLKNGTRSDSVTRLNEEAKQVNGGSGNESNEAESSGGVGGQDEPSALVGTSGEPSAKGLSSRKRKRNVHDAEVDRAKGSQSPVEAAKDGADGEEPNQTTMVNKTTGKHGKQGSQGSDPPKEEYIQVRARRGQATNSHSLAERVRREKISERMKFLQDLVPGCNKVTGKAVMLDEIINYVQPLQKQVEILSMKLATVNPRLDFSIEGLLAKDIMQS